MMKKILPHSSKKKTFDKKKRKKKTKNNQNTFWKKKKARRQKRKTNRTPPPHRPTPASHQAANRSGSPYYWEPSARRIASPSPEGPENRKKEVYHRWFFLDGFSGFYLFLMVFSGFRVLFLLEVNVYSPF